jgi:phage shock protein A
MRIRSLVKYRVLFARKSDLMRQVEELKRANTQLEEQAASAQRARMAAENLADELRKGNERHRSKIADQKRLIQKAERVTEQLREKCESLERTIAELNTRP